VGAVHAAVGLPQDRRLGAALAGVAGYRGGLRFLFDLANQVFEHHSTDRSSPC
jgi:nitrogenase molybdenum-iron protein NifN